MTEENERPATLKKAGGDALPQTEVARFYGEVGRDIVELDRMLRKTTETRPFVYEIRFDLWPQDNKAGLAVLKGFGAEGSLIAFQEGSGLLGQLRGLYSRASAGKLGFTIDKFPPGSYEARVKSWTREVEYGAAKLTNR